MQCSPSEETVEDEARRSLRRSPERRVVDDEAAAVNIATGRLRMSLDSTLSAIKEEKACRLNERAEVRQDLEAIWRALAAEAHARADTAVRTEASLRELKEESQDRDISFAKALASRVKRDEVSHDVSSVVEKVAEHLEGLIQEAQAVSADVADGLAERTALLEDRCAQFDQLFQVVSQALPVNNDRGNAQQGAASKSSADVATDMDTLTLRVRRAEEEQRRLNVLVDGLVVGNAQDGLSRQLPALLERFDGWDAAFRRLDVGTQEALGRERREREEVARRLFEEITDRTIVCKNIADELRAARLGAATTSAMQGSPKLHFPDGAIVNMADEVNSIASPRVRSFCGSPVLQTRRLPSPAPPMGRESISSTVPAAPPSAFPSPMVVSPSTQVGQNRGFVQPQQPRGSPRVTMRAVGAALRPALSSGHLGVTVTPGSPMSADRDITFIAKSREITFGSYEDDTQRHFQAQVGSPSLHGSPPPTRSMPSSAFSPSPSHRSLGGSPATAQSVAPCAAQLQTELTFRHPSVDKPSLRHSL